MAADSRGRLLVTSGYAKYIRALIGQLELEENVVFLGRLDAAQMVERMLQANVVVIPSAIEGTSLMLREGMFLGVPSIAAFRGGMADFVRDKESGFLYDYPEYSCLAYRILEVLGDDALAARFSANAIQQAEVAHDRVANPRKYLAMYREIQEGGHARA